MAWLGWKSSKVQWLRERLTEDVHIKERCECSGAVIWLFRHETVTESAKGGELGAVA